ncbi:MAG: serine/threonine-protein kinase, partial [Myxococcota bacterium]
MSVKQLSSARTLQHADISEALEGGAVIERFASDWEDDIEESPSGRSGEHAPPADPYLGSVINDRYSVESVIGEGGMGRVYLATHKVIGKRCAIKILHPDLARDKEAVGRFVREARAASSIGNAHIVDISDFGETVDGSTYFVMEYLDGTTLAQLIRNAKVLTTPEVIEIGVQMCDGLAAAHHTGIIHRDLKPDNIVLVPFKDVERFVKILDFGIAKVSSANANTKLTVAGTVFGTPHYMSPEQAAGMAVDPRADVYSLGVLMYEMACGELPFQADNFMGILTQHMYKSPDMVRSRPWGGSCSPELEAIILKCLAKRAEARYQSMEELAEDLKRHAAGRAVEAILDDTTFSGRFEVPAEFVRNNIIDESRKTTRGPRMLPRVAVGIMVGVGLGIAAFVGLTSTPEPRAPAAAAVSSAVAPPVPAEPTATDSDVPVPEDPAVDIKKVLVHCLAPGAEADIAGEMVRLPAN